MQTTDDDDRLTSLQTPSKEGQLSRLLTPQAAEIWAKVVESLPHNANLHLWKRASPSCTLCGERQSLIHVLNTCSVARDQRCFNARHDAVLREIVATVKEALPPTYHLPVDTGPYNFPHHIVPTDLRPNLVWWNDSQRVIFFAELTISSFLMAAERESFKYESLIVRAKENGL